jgi:hypothetical protein
VTIKGSGIGVTKDMSVIETETIEIGIATLIGETEIIAVIGGKTLLLIGVVIMEAGREADHLKVTDLTSAVIAGVTAGTVETVRKVMTLTGKRRKPLGGQTQLETGTTLQTVLLKCPVFNRATESSAMTLK